MLNPSAWSVKLGGIWGICSFESSWGLVKGDIFAHLVKGEKILCLVPQTQSLVRKSATMSRCGRCVRSMFKASATYQALLHRIQGFWVLHTGRMPRGHRVECTAQTLFLATRPVDRSKANSTMVTSLFCEGLRGGGRGQAQRGSVAQWKSMTKLCFCAPVQ